jgi:phenylacetate-coenzyme A ligase PaaK-like adenylate-forming protein
VIAGVAPRFVRRRAAAQRFGDARANLQRWHSRDAQAIAAHQLERLRAVWADVVEHVPYYRRLVERGDAPARIASLAQFFDRVPLLRRDDIVSAPNLFVRTDRPADAHMVTAGSTGNPLRFGVFAEEARPPAADLLTGRMANGLEEDDRIFLLWGHSHLLGTGLNGVRRHGVRKLKDWALGYRRSDAYRLDPASARSHMRAILDFRPQVLIGYSNALDLLVRHNLDLRDQARALQMKFVVATAEVLPAPDTRSLLEDFFGCPLAMEYGGVEFGAVAHSDPAGGYRVYWWDILLEAIDEGGSEALPAVVTALYPRYFPVIRYVNGDEIAGPLRLAGGSVIAFDEVKGRHHDIVRLPDGTVVHSVSLFHCIHQEPGVYNIQLVLEPSGIRILIVAGQPDQGMIDRIRHRLRSLGVRLSEAPIEVVPDLVTNRAGKRRWIVDRRTDG